MHNYPEYNLLPSARKRTSGILLWFRESSKIVELIQNAKLILRRGICNPKVFFLIEVKIIFFGIMSLCRYLMPEKVRIGLFEKVAGLSAHFEFLATRWEIDNGRFRQVMP